MMFDGGYTSAVLYPGWCAGCRELWIEFVWSTLCELSLFSLRFFDLGVLLQLLESTVSPSALASASLLSLIPNAEEPSI